MGASARTNAVACSRWVTRETLMGELTEWEECAAVADRQSKWVGVFRLRRCFAALTSAALKMTNLARARFPSAELLLRMGCAEGKLGDKKLAFVAIQENETQVGTDATSAEIHGCEVILPSRLGDEMGGGNFTVERALPVRAKVMNSGIDGNVEVGVAVRCSGPFAIDAHSGSWARARSIFRIVLDEIQQRLPRFGLDGVLLFISFHIEFGFWIAAGGRA